ncbi:hypothetical protein [Paraburkholderia aspalathi]|uniref:hypothetical protein n=1 Tax=Paraburkholderia aspalathi TaxID=1324617 RepID=UPI001B2E091C|nr:hypothetical protein [Paraburkholderia aspalathi]CAE6837241.1 hypothetical protein R20943_06930 [Paraburkholderia aspalathi]
MSRAFLTRNPTAAELMLLKKFLASYRDGSGNLREDDGSTRAEFRQIERCFAELLHGRTTENKAFYDFVVQSNEGGGIAVRGASIKTKEHAKLLAYTTQQATMRSHMELSNSNAKDWELCAARGLTHDMFRDLQHAADFGQAILDRQRIERQASETAYLNTIAGHNKEFVQQDCVYISLLYSPMTNGERTYQVSSFHAALPPPATWTIEGRRLIGKDENDQVVYEWYGLSGAQFKYYPKIADRLHGTELFTLADYRPAIESLRAKVSRMFGD